MRILVVFLLFTLAFAKQSRPNVRFQFEKAREKLYQLPPPEHDTGLATRVSDCISGKVRDTELCENSIVKFNNHIQDMYLRTVAIHQAEDAARAAIAEAEHAAEQAELTQTAEPIDTTKIPVKPREDAPPSE